MDAVWSNIRRRFGSLVLAALALILLPVLLALNLAPRAEFAAPAVKPTRDARITQLLEGEHLSPPPALPPDIFAALDVEQVPSSIGGISRDWSLLDHDFRQRLLSTFTLLREEHGYHAVLIEGYRSPERQHQLASSGRQVTRADAHMSYHQHGLAADVAFLRDGKLVISEQDPWAMNAYAVLGEVAEAAGLTWGGNWSLRDYGHVELQQPSRLAGFQPQAQSL